MKIILDEEDMLDMWRNRIEWGICTIADCPDVYKMDVINKMRKDYKDNIITYQQYKQFTGE